MPKSQWLSDESQLQEMVCEELDAHVRDLFAQVRQLDGGSALLRFLRSHVNTLRTADDIAYHLRQPAPVIERTLRGMLKLGLVRRIDASGVTWFGITLDPDRRRLVRDLCAWQDRWQARLEQIEHVICGKLSPSRRSADRNPQSIPTAGEF